MKRHPWWLLLFVLFAGGCFVSQRAHARHIPNVGLLEAPPRPVP